jgi:putative ABC transport system permease protein
VRALDRKLLRDLWHIKGQAIAIGLVIAAGVAMFVMYLSAFDSLRLTQRAYYERYRFGDVFAQLKRAPEALAARIARIPGVTQVDTRVVVDVTLAVPGMAEPVSGRLISMPAERRAVLNDVVIRRGRYFARGRPAEVLVNEAFALAHGLEPGATVSALINGRHQRLEIVGVAMSPEYVYTVRPGELIPDDRRFGIFWMERRALGAAFDMEGGFNDVSLRLSPTTTPDPVIARLDAIIRPYGALGAISRALQISHWSIDNELTQLQTVGLIVPIIFLAVAAFLLNVVLTRIVRVQREEIAALKALGYLNRELSWHYVKWSLAIASFGAVVGTGAGYQLGTGIVALYNQFFRFPVLQYRLLPWVVLVAVAISLVAGVLGALGAVRRAVTLPPAEAMRPEAPARYRPSVVERIGLGRWLSQPARMVLRHLQREPVRALTSTVGIALSAAMLVVGMFSLDALDEIMDMQFAVAQRQDLTVTFVEPRSAAALHEATRLPGVLAVERMRIVPARLRFGPRSRQLAISGIVDDAQLARVVDVSRRPVVLPPDGLVLSDKLASILGARPGDQLTVEVLVGDRPVRSLPLVGVVEEYMGTSAYMRAEALDRMLREGASVSGVRLLVDGASLDRLYARLNATPAVAGSTTTGAALKNFRDTFAQNQYIMIVYNVLFAGIIAFGVVYNAARVSLSERGRELATLRVIGFTRGEISQILLGELAVVTAAAVPIGLAVGYGFAALIVTLVNTELYRFPLVVYPRTYAFAAVCVAVSAALSGLIVRRRLDRLDLVAVLKTRE